MSRWGMLDASGRNRDESKLWNEFMSDGRGVALGLRQRCSQLGVSYNINTRADRERMFREEDCCVRTDAGHVLGTNPFTEAKAH